MRAVTQRLFGCENYFHLLSALKFLDVCCQGAPDKASPEWLLKSFKLPRKNMFPFVDLSRASSHEAWWLTFS